MWPGQHWRRRLRAHRGVCVPPGAGTGGRAARGLGIRAWCAPPVRPAFPPLAIALCVRGRRPPNIAVSRATLRKQQILVTRGRRFQLHGVVSTLPHSRSSFPVVGIHITTVCRAWLACRRDVRRVVVRDPHAGGSPQLLLSQNTGRVMLFFAVPRVKTSAKSRDAKRSLHAGRGCGDLNLMLCTRAHPVLQPLGCKKNVHSYYD